MAIVSPYHGWPNWFDKDEVIAYAKLLGKGMAVVLHANSDNYNIVHTVNVHLYSPCEVVFTS
jgi:hypothetical protein